MPPQSLCQAYTDVLARSSGAPPAAQQPQPPAAAGAQGAPAPARSDAPPAVTVLTLGEICQELFVWAHDEEVVDALHLQVGRAEGRLL